MINRFQLKHLVFLFFFLNGIYTHANTKNDPHLPISHCYHWLDEQNSGFLSYKYNFGNKNNGDIAFIAGVNGAAAGPGLYCAKSPSGSYSYGDRVIRLELVDDIVMLDDHTKKKYCGHNGDFYSTAECDSKPWDIKFYSGGGIGNSAWYVIKDPQAIKMWSANSDQLISDLNASKAINGGSASTHFDRTIQKIHTERSSLGELIYTNQNARMSILSILTKPELLRQMPPLTVISRILAVPTTEFDQNKKDNVYKTQFKRAFTDSFLKYQEFDDIIVKDSHIQKMFVSALKEIDFKNLDKINVVTALIGSDKFLKISSANAEELWKALLIGAGGFETILEAGLSDEGVIAKSFTKTIRSNPELLSKIQAHNLIASLTVFEKYIDAVDVGAIVSKNLETIFSNMIVNSNDLSTAYQSITNQYLSKERALEVAVNTLYKTKFKNLNPVVIGNIVDLLSSKVTLKVNYVNEVKLLPIPASKTPTYMILDDYEKGVTKLPSMISRPEYLMKMFDRVLLERGQKGMTNAFRFVFSDTFHLYFSEIKKEKDNAKKDILLDQAADFYMQFALSLDDEQFKSYAYIAVQNASFFKGGLKYDDHPMEFAYDLYQTGDAAYDAFFEKLSTYALEGSYMQFLIKKAEDEDKAKTLVEKTLNYFIDPSFDTWTKSTEFSVSQEEKEDWKNMIQNKFYTGSNSLVSSDLCRFSKILYSKKKYLDKVIDKALAAAVAKQNNNVYKMKICN